MSDTQGWRKDHHNTKTLSLTPDLVLLPRKNASDDDTGRAPNSYAFRILDRLLLVDAPFERLLDPIDALCNDWMMQPSIMFLTGAIAAPDADGLASLAARYPQMRWIVHPDYALPAMAPDIRFESPVEHELLRSLALNVTPMRGHTTGACMLYWPSHDGVLFAGDSAIGEGPRDAPDAFYLLRPPYVADDEALRECWRTFHATLQWVLPARGAFHNAERADLGAMVAMLRDQPFTVRHPGGALTRGPDEVPSARFLE